MTATANQLESLTDEELQFLLDNLDKFDANEQGCLSIIMENLPEHFEKEGR